MNLLVLGRGRTGALVAEIARECKHDVRVIGADDNVHAAGLTPEKLGGVDVVIDFTTPPNTTFQSITPPAGATCTMLPVGGTGTITCTFTNPVAPTVGPLPTFSVTVQINPGTTGQASPHPMVMSVEAPRARSSVKSWGLAAARSIPSSRITSTTSG